MHEGGAAARCAVGLIQGLEARGVRCHVLVSDDGIAPLNSPPGIEPELVRVGTPSRWRGRWNRLTNPLGDLSSGPFAERLRELQSTVDVVHLVEIRAASAQGSVSIPTVVQLDCATARDRRVGLALTRTQRGSLEQVRAERRVVGRAQSLLVSSEEVAEDMARKVPRGRVHVAPLALDPAHYPRRAPLDRPLAGVIGTASWPPTANAVKRLLTRVWPLVLEQRPEATLALAGHGMDAATFPQARGLAGVQLRGSVPSATDFLRELGVLLYPLSSGSGVKVKVLEALALGVPVVSTPAGAEGLGGLGGVVVERDDARLARATVALLDDRDARLAAGEQAYATFTAHHTPAVAAAPVLELYERLLA